MYELLKKAHDRYQLYFAKKNWEVRRSPAGLADSNVRRADYLSGVAHRMALQREELERGF